MKALPIADQIVTQTWKYAEAVVQLAHDPPAGEDPVTFAMAVLIATYLAGLKCSTLDTELQWLLDVTPHERVS